MRCAAWLCAVAVLLMALGCVRATQPGLNASDPLSQRVLLGATAGEPAVPTSPITDREASTKAKLAGSTTASQTLNVLPRLDQFIGILFNHANDGRCGLPSYLINLPTRVSGSKLFTRTTTWIVPLWVYSVSVVCVAGGGSGAVLAPPTSGTNPNDYFGAGGGGGALAWANDYRVKPGCKLDVVVGGGGVDGRPGGPSYFVSPNVLLASGGGGGNGVRRSNPGTGDPGVLTRGGAFTVNAASFRGGSGGGAGGNGYPTGAGNNDGITALLVGGGGGAGGYRGPGGDASGAADCPSASLGGGGGGGDTAFFNDNLIDVSLKLKAGSGGGVGVLGEGPNGDCGGTCSNCIELNGNFYGLGGSGGGNGSPTGGGKYGGGSAGVPALPRLPGGAGACRIIWGSNRAFPTTNTA